MTEPYILHLETATNVCSAALSKGREIIASRISYEDRSHGTLLTVFIKEILAETKLGPEVLNAIAVSKGPGSYTGLRIGVSVTKGLAYGQSIPVIGIPTLEIMAKVALEEKSIQNILDKEKNALLCPMIDARRMEVFTAVYTLSGEEVQVVNAKIIDENSFAEILEEQAMIFMGNGSEKLIDTIQHSNAHFVKDITPLASGMLQLALNKYEKEDFEDTAYFEPFYLKDFVATIPKKKVL